MGISKLIWEERYDVVNDDEEEMVPESEDAVINEPHFAPGFQRKDKPYIEGYAAGLDAAIKFCDHQQDSRAIKMQLEKIRNVLKNEADWIF